MSKKFNINLEALEQKEKKRIASIEISGKKIDFPLSLKNELELREILTMSEMKLRSLQSDGKLRESKPINFKKLPNNKQELVRQALNFTDTLPTVVMIHDEDALIASANERNFMYDKISVVCNIDFDYIVDEETQEKYIDIINKNLNVNLKSTDYKEIVQVFYKYFIFNPETVRLLKIHIEALDRDEEFEMTEQRWNARAVGADEVQWLEDIKEMKKEMELEEELKKKEESEENEKKEEESEKEVKTKTRNKKKQEKETPEK